MSEENAVYYDPYNVDIVADPYPVYRALRETHPVFYSPQGRFWAISRYDDVLEALGRPAMFSSRRSPGEPAPDDPSAYMPLIVLPDHVDDEIADDTIDIVRQSREARRERAPELLELRR